MEYVNAVGNMLYKKLVELAGKYEFVKDVRGMGLLLGMELAIEGKAIVDGCREKGLLINCVNNNVLRFIPPLTIDSFDVKCAVKILDEVMSGIKI